MVVNKEKTVQEVKRLVAEYFRESSPKNPKYKVPLMSRLYDEDEVAEVVDTLLTPERLTLNASGDLKTERFEEMWAKFIGVKNGVMVNSGSSANLVAFYMLTNPAVINRLKPGDEIVTPALTWSTSISPMFATGMTPVLVDSNLDDYNMDTNQLEAAIGPRTKAILAVHLLGFPIDMDEVMRIAKKRNLFVIEDCCESPGAEWKGKRVGSFGDISTFSFYLSHHITTLEGGMVMVNDDDMAELARIIRSQGVMRNVKSQAYKDKINSMSPEIDPRFLFANTGYNFRTSEMEGAFGVVQFKKFDKYFRAREENAAFFNKELGKFSDFLSVSPVKRWTRPAWFCYPVAVKDTKVDVTELRKFLEQRGIETRPVMGGDYTRHPVARLFNHRVVGDLPNTRFIHKNAFLIGVHAGIGKEERDHVISAFEEFFRKRR
ncbi:MAG: aminotransferase class I/II-fold pyridoxal phosphate-dependent enzyme [Candidatus Aenigmatarchaeota archaeon]